KTGGRVTCICNANPIFRPGSMILRHGRRNPRSGARFTKKCANITSDSNRMSLPETSPMTETTQAFFPLHPQVQEIRVELDAMSACWHRFLAGLTDGQWARKPSAEAWSPAECLIHLNISSEKFIPVLTDALHKGQQAGPKGVGPLKRDIA